MKQEKKGRRATPMDQPMIDINTTPLIDVMLVLLIMLIITIPVQLHSVNLNMPTGNPPPLEVKPEVLRIDIDAGSVVSWNGEPVAQRDELERRMTEQAVRTPQPEVHLRPDRKARYEIVAGVLASAQRTGLTKIGVVGSEQFIQ
ncbi:MAG TPA: biopolymer transporter ExbD [Burkholderiaceae bacterium]|nr:biopolymer transporter ExbD [Burkholderiaceae bacterium]